MSSYERTVEDFVEDCMSDGKTWEEIRVIVLATRWHDKKDEVLKVYEDKIKNLKKHKKN